MLFNAGPQCVTDKYISIVALAQTSTLHDKLPLPAWPSIAVLVYLDNVFVYRCIHWLFRSLILQVSRLQPVDRAPRGSFGYYHPTSIAVSTEAMSSPLLFLSLLAVCKQWLYLLVVFVTKALQTYPKVSTIIPEEVEAICGW